MARLQSLKTHEPVDAPMMRKVTFGELGEPVTQDLVLSLMQTALYEDIPPDKLAVKLATGQIQAYWILTEQGVKAGILAFECGEEDDRRILYIISATVGVPITLDGWQIIYDYLRMIAVSNRCSAIEFDTMPNNQRMVEIGRAFGGIETVGKLKKAPESINFVLEV